jgi:thiosulfate reductase cytochrome b subunit
MARPPRAPRVNSLRVRLTHWLNALAIGVMMTSGWRIYDASPFFGFMIPAWATLGDWLGGAIAWHLAAMWLLVGNFVVMVGFGIISGHLRRRLLPIRPAELRRDLWLALTFRLPHRPGVYNAVQRLLYVLVLGAIAFAIASGFALWKPVQLDWLSALFGGYEATRRVHFLSMTAIAGFIAVHLTLVAIVPSTLVSMVTGGRLPVGTDGEPA